jgi:broad specificity phosphatase PhoE
MTGERTAPPGCEDQAAACPDDARASLGYAARVAAAMDAILAAHPESNVVVSHGGALSAYLAQ